MDCVTAEVNQQRYGEDIRDSLGRSSGSLRGLYASHRSTPRNCSRDDPPCNRFLTVSETAAAYAAALAHRFGSSVELIHVIDLSVATTSESAVVGLSLEEMRSESNTKLERLREMFAGMRAEIRQPEAFSISSAIHQAATKASANLIVMGTTSKHGLEKLVLGSTAESVIRKSTCPGAHSRSTCPAATARPLAFQTIVYATDFSEQSAKAGIYALSFAQDSGARLYFCYVLGVHKPQGAEPLVLQASFEKSLRQLIPQSGIRLVQSRVCD